jgi:CheY-like chemotaxis protein
MIVKQKARRFLLVEDEILLVMMVEDMLRDFGCASVASVSTAEQAIRLIESQAFDAALLDVNLQGRKSDAVADALALRHIPFIFCTGSAQVEVAPRFQDRPFLRKPFGCEDLARAVERLPGAKSPAPR